MTLLWLKLAHILGGITFITSHGISSAIGLKLRKERDAARIRALLALSRTTLPWMYSSLALLLVAGVISGLLRRDWSRYWIWVSLIALILLIVVFGAVAARYYRSVRVAVGMPRRGPYTDGAMPVASTEEIVALLDRPLSIYLGIFGYGVIGYILYLMVFKPY